MVAAGQENRPGSLVPGPPNDAPWPLLPSGLLMSITFTDATSNFGVAGTGAVGAAT
jgi:hypothetical protein